jgi:proteasome accessory factor B
VAGVSKLERLLNLTAILLHTRVPLTAEHIRDRVEGYPPAGPAFHRAFERDKDDLRSLGIPLRVERVPYQAHEVDGYRIRPEEYYLADPGLDADELAALHLASLAVRLGGSADREALWKLGGLVEGAGEVANVAVLPADDRLGPLFGAITERRTVAFGYRGEDRRVDPHRLDFRKGRWYLTGFDRDRQDRRNFRLDRIDGPVRVQGPPGAFPPPAGEPGLALEAWRFGDGEPVEARLLVDAPRAPWVRRHLGDGAVAEERADGSVVFAVPVANRPAFRSFVLDLLDHAEILDPPELRRDLIGWLEAMASPDVER